MGKGIRGRLAAFTRRVFFAVRAVALTVFLVLAYVVGVGLTRLFTLPLPRRVLGVRRLGRTPAWIAPEPPETVLERLKEPY